MTYFFITFTLLKITMMATAVFLKLLTSVKHFAKNLISYISAIFKNIPAFHLDFVLNYLKSIS